MSTVGIVVPFYNEGSRLGQVYQSISEWAQEHLQDQVVLAIVDDGSSVLGNFDAIPSSALHAAHLLRHSINLGQGAAIQTGISFLQQHYDPDFFVTMDGDGQHSVSDLNIFFEVQAIANADIVFGNRFGLGRTIHIPTLRKFLLNTARIFENYLTGVSLQDAHNGYRLFTRQFAEKLQIRQNRMAHATEFKIAARGFIVAEAPVNIHYSKETLKKGQSGLGSFRIIRDLLGYYIFQI